MALGDALLAETDWPRARAPELLRAPRAWLAALGAAAGAAHGVFAAEAARLAARHDAVMTADAAAVRVPAVEGARGTVVAAAGAAAAITYACGEDVTAARCIICLAEPGRDELGRPVTHAYDCESLHTCLCALCAGTPDVIAADVCAICRGAVRGPPRRVHRP